MISRRIGPDGLPPYACSGPPRGPPAAGPADQVSGYASADPGANDHPFSHPAIRSQWHELPDNRHESGQVSR